MQHDFSSLLGGEASHGQRLIPVNTLMGLPDELVVPIVRHVVKHDCPINILKLRKSLEQLLYPLTADPHLAAIGRQEALKVSAFAERLTVRTMRRGKRYIPSTLNQADRIEVRHLRVRLPLQLKGGAISPPSDPAPERFGTDQLAVLELLPSVYPNVESLQLDLMVEHKDHALLTYTLLHKGGRESQSATWRLWELSVTVRNIIIAFSKFRTPALTAKSLTLTQDAVARNADFDDDGEYKSLKIAETVLLRRTVQKMIDLPASRIDVVPLCWRQRGHGRAVAFKVGPVTRAQTSNALEVAENNQKGPTAGVIQFGAS